MTQTSNRLFDEIGKLVTDAAGVANGLKREVDTLVRAQMERFMADMDMVSREDFETVKAMAVRAREENEKLSQRLAMLEAVMGSGCGVDYGDEQDGVSDGA